MGRHLHSQRTGRYFCGALLSTASTFGLRFPYPVLRLIGSWTEDPALPHVGSVPRKCANLPKSGSSSRSMVFMAFHGCVFFSGLSDILTDCRWEMKVDVVRKPDSIDWGDPGSWKDKFSSTFWAPRRQNPPTYVKNTFISTSGCRGVPFDYQNSRPEPRRR